jgi:hypothetical protein
MFHTRFVEKIKTHILYSKLFSENCVVYEIMWKNTVQPDRPRWQYKTAHAYCMLDKEVYRTTFWICNSYCFSTAPNVMLCASKLRSSARCLWCFYACLIIYACLLFELHLIRVKIYVRIYVVRRKRTLCLWQNKMLKKNSPAKTDEM